MKAAISRVVSTLLTSRLARDLSRARHRSRGQPVIDYFHQVDDPYSHLALQTLAPLAQRYRVQVRPWLVPPPDDAAAPERERLRHYAVRDAARVAEQYGLAFPSDARLPDAGAVSMAADLLASRLAESDFADRALALGEALWTGASLPPGRVGDGATELAAGQAEREERGHYLGGMFLFEGEWFWGVDRLNHLEERLADRGLDTTPEAPPIAPYRDIALDGAPAIGRRPVLECWFSIRSPYSWIALPRVRRLAAHYNAELRLRPILPMVMRGLPVPRIKSRYIMRDTKREAERVGLPFGTMVDPVGKGAERAIALVCHAMPMGLAEDVAEAALRGAFAEGVDLGEEKGFYALARRVGILDEEVDAALGDETWRKVAEENREALFEAGLWGPPSFRVDAGPAHWGQDRLWAVEADLKRAIAAGWAA